MIQGDPLLYSPSLIFLPLLYSGQNWLYTGFLRTPRRNPGPHGRSSPCGPQTYRAALWARMSPRLDPGPRTYLASLRCCPPWWRIYILLSRYHETNIGQYLAKFLILVRYSDNLNDIGVFEVNILIFSIVCREIKDLSLIISIFLSFFTISLSSLH